MNDKMFLWGVFTAMLAVGLYSSAALACFAVVVGKDASADGSVLLGHNEQNGGQRFINFRKVPRIEHEDGEMLKLWGGAQVKQVKENYAFLWSENPGIAYSDGYLNEWGVAVVSDGCPDREDNPQKLEARGQLVKGGIGYLLRRLIIERARTAREGVQVAARLIEAVGYRGSRTLVIADPKEAWLLAMSRGKHWVARRVPDREVVLLPNVYIIGEVNLQDQADFLGSPNLIEYAINRGWYDPAGGEKFRFYEVYAQRRKIRMDRRQWRGQCLVLGKEIKPEPDRQLPFSVRPAHKLNVEDVITILRYHGVADLCSQGTQEGAVFQLRSNMPPEIGCIYWRTSAEPCTSVLTPWYAGITETPDEYYQPVELERQLTLDFHFAGSPVKFHPVERHAWWIFKKLQDQVNRDREKRWRTVRAVWDEFEARIVADQPVVEKKAMELYQKDKSSARVFLTAYSRSIALQAVRKARELARQLEKEL